MERTINNNKTNKTARIDFLTLSAGSTSHLLPIRMRVTFSAAFWSIWRIQLRTFVKLCSSDTS